MPECNKKTPPNYNGEKYNPYYEALEDYQEKHADLIIGKRNWQRATFCLALIAIASMGMNAVQVTQTKHIPVIVQTDANTGTVIGSPFVIDAARQPNEKEIQYFLWQVICKTRTIPLDPVIYRKNWLDAYKFLAPAAANKLSNWAKEEGQMELLDKKYASTLELKSYTPLPEQDNTYQVRWQETYYDANGKVASKVIMNGFFVLQFEEVTDILVNPFGMEIKELTLSKEN